MTKENCVDNNTNQMTRIEQLEAELAALRAEVRAVREPPTTERLEQSAPMPRSSRRHMLRLVGGLAAGGAAATVVGAGRAAAIDGLTITAASATSTANQVMVTSTDATLGTKFLFRGGGSTATNTTHGGALIGAHAAGLVDGVSVRTAAGAAGRFRSSTGVGMQVTGTSSLQLFAEGSSINHHITFGTPQPSPYSTGGRQSHALDSCHDGLWFNVGDGSDTSWRKLAGAATAGSLHPIATARVYDSRKVMTPMANGILATGASRVIDVSDKRDTGTGAVTLADVVPEHSTAVAYNLTVVNTVGGNGFLAVEPGDAVTNGGSAINWSASGLVLANASVAKLGLDRQLKVFCGGTATSCHFIIDIVGYYL